MGPTTLIGRAPELAELEDRARSGRLVTVVGPGGVGKTALASAVVERLANGFPLGVRRVDLTRVDDPTAVPGALAAQLGFDSFDALLGSPADQPVLLVVDNCEHLLDAIAAALAQILGACLQPTVIATSRSPLELPGESILPLAPLPLPAVGEDPLSCPSVALFLRRGREAGADVDDADLSTVVDLCCQLDGLPLALEIAAARARTMSVAEISARLTDSVDVLARPRFRGEPRHRSVAETISWSHGLLSPGAADLLELLGVFAGSFAADSARAVAATADRAAADRAVADRAVADRAVAVDTSADGAGQVDRSGGSPDVDGSHSTPDFDDLLDELVTASLVVVDTSGPATRYRLLDTVRRFARDRLAAGGATLDAHDRFVDHVVARSRERMAGAAVTWRADLVHDLVESYDDVAEAMRWCLAHDPDPRRAHHLAAALWVVVHQAHAEDIVELMRQVVERFPEQGTRGAAQVAAVLASAEYVTGDPATARSLAERTLVEHDRDDIQAVLLHRVLGQARSAVGDRPGAIEAFTRGAEIGDRLGMAAMAQELVVARATVTADHGDVDGALGLVAGVIEQAEASDSTLTVAWARAVEAWLLVRVDPTAALVRADAAETVARRIGYPIALAVDVRTRAFAHLILGDLTAAVAALQELLGELLDQGALSNARVLLDALAAVAHRAGHPRWEVLAATARALPITTLVSAQLEVVPLPPTSASPLPRHEVFRVARDVLGELASMSKSPPPTATPASPASPGSPTASPSATATSPETPDTSGPSGPTGSNTSTGSDGGDAPSSTVRTACVARRGDVVEIDFAGRSVTVRTSKGVTDIVRLLAAEGREIHCLDLTDATIAQASTGEVIDTTARRQYEDRIRELQEEIDEAERDNDHARSYRYQVELDALIDHLTAALGRGGDTRRSGGDAERARSAVTHRVRAAIRQLDKLHPTLGHHLAHAINTGTYCSYRPEQPVTWQVDP